MPHVWNKTEELHFDDKRDYVCKGGDENNKQSSTGGLVYLI